MLVPQPLWERCKEMQTLFCGKRAGRPSTATNVVGLLPSRLFYVTDCASGLRFLVDTGAEVSVIPPSRTERIHQQDNLSLQAANNNHCDLR